MSDPINDPAVQVRRPEAQHDENVVDLVRDLTRQGSHLAQEQMKLMQAEVREAADDLKKAIGAMAGAAVVGISGLGVLLMGLGYLLGDAIENVGLGILIVGIITLIIAAIMYSSGKKKMNNAELKPERTIRTAEDTPAAATGHKNSVGGPNDR